MRKIRQFQQSLRARMWWRIALLLATCGVFAGATSFGMGFSDHVSAQTISANTAPTYSGGHLMAADPRGGYWVVNGDGAITPYGGAPLFGSPATSAIQLSKPIMGMAATPDGQGYWLVASDGGIFSFGDATFYGSTGAMHLNQPIVGMAVTPSGGGYWLVAADGGIFSFGDATFYGSTGAMHLIQPIVGMAVTPSGGGYWLVAADGGIFSFGDATFYGSLSGAGDPTIGIIISPPTLGYTLVQTDGTAVVLTRTPSTAVPPTTTPSPTTTTTAPPFASTSGSGPSTAPPALGAYAGVNNLSGLKSFASATGANITMAETYLPFQANTGSAYGWDYLTSLTDLTSWLSTWLGTSDQMVIGVPMVALDGSGDPENTLAEGAAGDENSKFVAIAQNLVALGFGNAILRPGWEFDGTWSPWTVGNNTDAANFATYWQNIVTAMRSVPGANFKFLWSPAGFQSLSWDINDAYPGNSYVDYVSLDVYDWSWDSSIFTGGDPNNTATVAQSNAVFNEFLTDTEGLNWLASFALAHDKPIVIPEWAVTIRNDGHGLGDDSTFINNMYNWFISNHVAWVIYFTDDVADDAAQGIDFLITDGNFPNSLAAFKTDFG